MSVSITIRELNFADQPEAVALLVRGMSDNPIHLRAFGANTGHRERALRAMFNAIVTRQLSRGIVLGAFHDGALMGVSGMMPPGHCPSAIMGKISALSALVLGGGLRDSRQLLEWLDDWMQTDVAVEHWHLGPIAVEPRWRGRGIGSRLIEECCEIIDRDGCAAYLENDKAENLRLLERCGFVATEVHAVLGIRNWFMLRPGQR